MRRIFISYSRKDEAFARQLATSLEALEADIWLDIEDIPAGIKWSTAIQEGLARSDVMLVVISPDSLVSRNVEDEWQFYHNNKKPIIPVLIRAVKTEDIHFQLRRIQYVDFLNQPYSAALQDLHAELKKNGVELLPPETITTQTSPAAGAPTMQIIFAAVLTGIVALAVLTFLSGNGGGNNFTEKERTEAAIAKTNAAAGQMSLTPASGLHLTATAQARQTQQARATATWEYWIQYATSWALYTQTAVYSLDLTATATLFTFTPTPNITASINAYLTQQAATVTSTPSPQPTSTAPAATSLPPTQLAATVEPTTTPVILAALPVEIRNLSGMIVGDGTLNLYAPDRIEYLETARIELELQMNHLYITPTPIGPIVAEPVIAVTSTSRPGISTPTPRIPVFVESGQYIYERMGASLTCPPSSFEGCDDSDQSQRLRRIDAETATWTWRVKPLEDVSGWQDLEVELWTMETVGDVDTYTTRWSHAFQIEVNPKAGVIDANSEDDGFLNTGLMVLGGLLLVTFLGIGVWAVRRVRRPTIFISYQRRTGWSTANNLHHRLTAAGASAFIDVHDLNEGRFAEVIEKEIITRDHFVVVLAPGTLDSEWVCKEIALAIRHNKNVVPVLVDGFILDEKDLPEAIKGLAAFNAVTLDPLHFETDFDRLKRFVRLKQ